MTVEFRLLGAIEAYVGGRPLDLGHPRQRGVLAVLLVEANCFVTTGHLLDCVWGEHQPVRGRNTLYSYLSRLRLALESVDGVSLDRRSGGYQLTLDKQCVDVHRFHRLVAEARAADDDRASVLFERALALWRGEPLAGLDTLWAAEVRATFEGEFLAAELDYIDIALRLGRHAEMLPLMSARARRHPLDERGTAQLMLALYRNGRQADALEHYRRLRTRLVDELGAEPGPELRELHRRILRDDAGLEASPRPVTAADPPPERPAPDELDRAAEELATAVFRQWTAEVELRSLQRPEPVQVRWAGTGRPVAASDSAVLGGRRDGVQRLDLRGGLTDLVSGFRRLPARQLVVLGEPGAGKTVLAILLALGLLADAGKGEPVPVVLPLSSWDPVRQHLHTWLAGKLLEEYPGLGNRAVYGRDAATRLVAEGRVVPVLDGLDEIPPALHAVAIDALDQAMAGARPLVVTCRGDEYEDAVRDSGAILARAAVVEIDPVGPDDAIEFLTARQRQGDTRWQPVAEHLRHRPGGPLARALSTPLMVDLARVAHADPAADPGELCDDSRFPDATLVEEHLLDAFLPAVYAQRPAPPDTRPAARHQPEQAQQWLTFLARHLRDGRSRDFAWWHLVSAVSPPTRALLLGLPPGLLCALTSWLAGGVTVGVVSGATYTVAGCLTNALGRRSGPRRVEPRFRGTRKGFLWRFGLGVAIAIGLSFGWSLTPGVVAVLAVVFGLSLGVHVWLDVPVDATRVSSPRTVLRQDRAAVLAYAVSFAVSLGLFFGVVFWFNGEAPANEPDDLFDPVRGTACLLTAALFGYFLFGRLGSVVYALPGAAIGGQVRYEAVLPDLPGAVVCGVLFAVTIGLSVLVSRPWGAFVVVRAWLWCLGRTPARLTRFLDDAHRRGVLRQVGAVYQFRHARLQDRLARDH
ncbi:BTAD domain-containing putative transcriptional regulator [Saccharothrix violaceirubra]|uniref:DNA-binding SARP family transcriptional activator n=1 Tax=Saccharothrix violaceirubra TaxID=413306 RepID=A0A7W7T534_9PSEU|nr:AfsR/SARP family transcriptional regulator [Saccharothrix violaceirubra]MBB4966764.1 DNA-binding SARP family transcriptional activator [Saccharothrix violaceirubra]